MPTTTAELGSLRENFGELRGTVRGIQQTTDRLEKKLDEVQRDSLAAHLRLDASIASIQTRLDTNQGIKKQTSDIVTHIWRASYTLSAAAISSFATWYLSSGSGGAHP